MFLSMYMQACLHTTYSEIKTPLQKSYLLKCYPLPTPCCCRIYHLIQWQHPSSRGVLAPKSAIFLFSPYLSRSKLKKLEHDLGFLFNGFHKTRKKAVYIVHKWSILNIHKIQMEKKFINNIWRKKFFEKPCCFSKGEEAFLRKMQYSETIREMTERDLIK